MSSTASVPLHQADLTNNVFLVAKVFIKHSGENVPNNLLIFIKGVRTVSKVLSLRIHRVTKMLCVLDLCLIYLLRDDYVFFMPFLPLFDFFVILFFNLFKQPLIVSDI